MYSKVFRFLNNSFILILLLLVLQSECKRKGGGGRRTGGGGGGGYTTPRSHNYQQSNSGTHDQDRNHQTNTYQTNSYNPQPPSAPISPSSNNPNNIGFERFNQPQGNPGIGFENVQNRAPSNSQPGASNIGFNVPQNNYPQTHGTGFNVPQQNTHLNPGNAYPPQGGFQNTHYQPNNGYNPSGSNYNTHLNNGNYNPNYNQFGGHNTYNPHLQGSGYHNPNLAQPGSYYNPNYGIPGGAPPPIYQPVQQSSGIGSTLLGYGGSFAGGYLIGKLTSGGHDSGDKRYEVHHYHHNRDEIPKRTSVSNSSLVVCNANETQGLCVPNTFPICLTNGTILCVTHLPYTVACGQNQSMSCVITVFPCVNGTNCNSTTDNSLNTVVYVPCISNVTVAKPSELQNMSLPGSDLNGSNNQIELCVTAIAEPKKLESPAMSYFNVIEKLLEFPVGINISSEISLAEDGKNETVTTRVGNDGIHVSS